MKKKKKFRLLTFIPIVTKFLERYIVFTVFSAHNYFRKHYLSLAACATRNGAVYNAESHAMGYVGNRLGSQHGSSSSGVVPDVF